jgi:hypothetical protein
MKTGSSFSPFDPPAAIDAVDERRSTIARRLKVFIPISICTKDGADRAHMINVSTTGAKLHMDRPLTPGASAEILIAGRRFSVTVRWSAAASCHYFLC